MAPAPTRPLPISDPDEVRSALTRVGERDRRVVELRYGLTDGRARSRAEIGRLLGISRERVRQLETRALDQLTAHASASHAGRAACGGPPATPHANLEPSRHSALRSWILVLLGLHPSHVYELRARLRELGLPPATYRLLQALEADGFLASSWAAGRGAGPSRRVYSLTPVGVEQLRQDAPALEKMAETLALFLAEEEFRPEGE